MVMLRTGARSMQLRRSNFTSHLGGQLRCLNNASNPHQFQVKPPILVLNPATSKPPVVHGDDIKVYSDVRGDYVKVPHFWLRDHCHCSSCFHGVTKQRVVESFDEISSDISVSKDGITETSNNIHVKWSDGHESVYERDWLTISGLKRHPRASERHAAVDIEFWNGEGIRQKPPVVDYDAVMSDESSVKSWLTLIRKYGFSYIENCPITPEASQKLLERIAFIRNTHYGGFYDFTADLSSGDTAYTQLGIGAHTDNTYFSDPAGLQMFHLLSHTDGTGGKSQLVDGFGAANELLERHPEAYHILATSRVHSHASGSENISIQPHQAFPVLCHDPQGNFLVQVRWNTTDRAAIDLPIEDMDQWYDAARKWTEILRRREYWDQLLPGRPLIFDNWRVLHGRSAFTGNRRICGGYVNRDDWVSRFRLLNEGRDSVLEAVARG